MKSLFIVSALSFSLALTGCSSKPEPSEKIVKTIVIKADNGSTLNVDGYEQLKTNYQAPTDISLRYITRGDTSAAVVLSTFSFVLGAMAGGAQAKGFTKDELKGASITALSNPTINWFSAEIEKTLRQDVAEKQAGQLKAPLEIRPYIWMLVYENLSGGDNYELHYSVDFKRKKDKTLSEYSMAFLACNPEPVKAPLAQWQANNYQKVSDVTLEMMQGCLRQFNDRKTEFLQ